VRLHPHINEDETHYEAHQVDPDGPQKTEWSGDETEETLLRGYGRIIEQHRHPLPGFYGAALEEGKFPLPGGQFSRARSILARYFRICEKLPSSVARGSGRPNEDRAKSRGTGAGCPPPRPAFHYWRYNEMCAQLPLRRFEFANNSEEDRKSLSILASGVRILPNGSNSQAAVG